MTINSHEIYRFESAAQAFCFRVGESPYLQVTLADGSTKMYWQIRAEQMAELYFMMQTMRDFTVAP